MGQGCSSLTCRHVENPETAEMSRMDSPDPVMYDLMRKSIQATTLLNDYDDSDVVQGSIPKSGKRRPVGQSHLLYKNHVTTKGHSMSSDTPIGGSNNNASLSTAKGELFTSASPVAENNINSNTSPRRAMESRSGGKSGTSQKGMDGQHTKTSSSETSIELEVPSSSPLLKCPTRLLIRRRSLRVVEEGGGTHIYAIRYPEDTSQMIFSEQSASFAPVFRQEQCPPRKTPASASVSSIANDTSSSVKVGYPELGGCTKTTSTTSIGNMPSQDTKPSACTSVKKDDNSASVPALDSTICAKGPSILSYPVLTESASDVFTPASMAATPSRKVLEWVTVSEEHNIYVADLGMTAGQCDRLVMTTEQVCRGQYAAYTYAKQTLGCREFPTLAQASFDPVHTIVHAITNKFPPCQGTPSITSDGDKASSPTDKRSPQSSDSAVNYGRNVSANNPEHVLQLDDREPHIVKYDVTRKERQKLEMHTDKSEWTFLIALSNGCGVDYEGGGTYFECLDATVHIQRGHVLVFPGKLRHCGQKITSGLRFLLVGFLVDKLSTSSMSGKNHAGGKSSSKGSNSLPISGSSGDTRTTNDRPAVDTPKIITLVSEAE